MSAADEAVTEGEYNRKSKKGMGKDDFEEEKENYGVRKLVSACLKNPITIVM